MTIRWDIIEKPNHSANDLVRSNKGQDTFLLSKNNSSRTIGQTKSNNSDIVTFFYIVKLKGHCCEVPMGWFT